MSAQWEQNLWAALPFPGVYLGHDDRILRINAAGETLLGKSERQLQQQKLNQIFANSSVVLDTIAQVRQTRNSLAVYGVEIPTAAHATWQCNLLVNFVDQNDDSLLLCFQPTGAAEKLGRSMTHRTAARSISGMSAVLAHEIRNPLAGISGAAQLLAMNADHDGQALAEMIAQEAKRIGTLVDKFEHFSDNRPVRHQPFNIHDVLDRALRSASAGFGAGVGFHKTYDPSLPAASGDHDQILQVFLNIIKNACEAVSNTNGQIRISTTYHSGVKFAAGGAQGARLPLQIKITDNGCGIAKTMINEIFDPFVSSKTNGTGLGLPLVSKILTDHGGLIEVESSPAGTSMIVRLPIWTGQG